MRWGKKWGKVPHRFQPISADLDLEKTALDRAPRSPADLKVRAHKRTVRVGTRQSQGIPPCESMLPAPRATSTIRVPRGGCGESARAFAVRAGGHKARLSGVLGCIGHL
jgi:hypothetical protein